LADDGSNAVGNLLGCIAICGELALTIAAKIIGADEKNRGMRLEARQFLAFRDAPEHVLGPVAANAKGSGPSFLEPLRPYCFACLLPSFSEGIAQEEDVYVSFLGSFEKRLVLPLGVGITAGGGLGGGVVICRAQREHADRDDSDRHQ